MSYEINVMVLAQKTPTNINFHSNMLLQNEVEDFGVNRYSDIWPFFSHADGILYSFVSKINESFYSSYQICDTEFETILLQETFPNWISTEEREDLTPLIIRNKFYSEFVKALQCLIESSPRKMVLFQTRYQSKDEEIVLGVIKLKKFIEMLEKNRFYSMCVTFWNLISK